jgi:hypothetical protein
MCRSIRPLHNFVPPATDEEVRAAALQYVRKVSGFTRPSQANVAAFEDAVAAVADATKRLVGSLVTSAAPRTREAERERARERWRRDVERRQAPSLAGRDEASSGLGLRRRAGRSPSG